MFDFTQVLRNFAKALTDRTSEDAINKATDDLTEALHGAVNAQVPVPEVPAPAPAPAPAP